MLTYEVIQCLCIKNNIAVTALEKKLGFGRGSIGKMRNGSTSVKRLQQIADYFGVSIDYLMTGEEVKKEENAEVKLCYGGIEIELTEENIEVLRNAINIIETTLKNVQHPDK